MVLTATTPGIIIEPILDWVELGAEAHFFLIVVPPSCEINLWPPHRQRCVLAITLLRLTV